MSVCAFARVCVRGVACVVVMGSVGAAAQETQSERSSKEVEIAQSAPKSGETAAPAKSDGSSLPEIVVKSDEKPKAKKAKAKAKPAGGNSPGGAVAGAAAEAKPVESDPVDLNKSLSDTGTTVFDARSVKARTLGGGDANTFVRNLPNVQYQNETSEDAGTNAYREIDTKPLLFSISGGRTYENNIILNGIAINNVVGPIERGDPKLDEDEFPLDDVIYGTHPQNVYVPAEFVEKATIIDSNASAKYGDFLGGAVIYDLASPPTDRWHGTLDYERHTDDMVHYKIGTVDGTNPLSREAPTFTKDNVAISVGGPVTTDFAVIGQYSGKFAETKKQKDYEFFDKTAGMESSNDFFRGAASLKTDYGRFKLESSLTDYVQTWESASSRDQVINVESYGHTTQLEHKDNLSSVVFSPLGINGVSVTNRAFYNDSETANVSNADEAWSWRGMVRRKGLNDPATAWKTIFDATLTDDYCRALPIEALVLRSSQNITICREGGWSSIKQGQEDLGVQSEMTGNLLWGSFLLGGEAKNITGTRERPRDFTNYSQFRTLGEGSGPVVTSFICPPGDRACTSEQYATTVIVQPAFNIETDINTVNLFTEFDQTFGWVNMRGGVRFDFDDYAENANFAPRLAGTVSPFAWFSVTGGYNRYYSGPNIAYAVRDAQPRAITKNRGLTAATAHDADGNVSKEFRVNNNTGFSYDASDLETPYADEYTGAIRIKEPLLGGHFRIRYLERHSEDQYSRENCPGGTSTLCNVLTNNGERFYHSWTGEYTTAWRTTETPFLSSVGLTGSIVWSEQTANRGTIFDGDGSEIYILYKEQKYTEETFTAVTGNLDIPIRVGATLSTSWFNDMLTLDFHAGFNFGYEGVYNTEVEVEIDGLDYLKYEDRTFKNTLTLDLTGQLNVTENAAMVFEVNNLTDSIGNSVASNQNPWVHGRSFWLGTKIRM